MSASLLQRAFNLKHTLINYGLEHFSEAYQSYSQQIFAEQTASEDEILAFQDWFVLECRLSDHRTILSHFIDHLDDGADVLIAKQWGMVIRGVFHVRHVLDNNHFELMNLVNDVLYHVVVDSAQQLALKKGEYIVARLLPHQDYHLFTGIIDRVETRKKDEIYELVTEIQLHDPKMAFIDNVDRIEIAYRIQHEELRDFIAFFGDDEIILSGKGLEGRLKEFYHYRFFQKKQQDSGSTMAKVFQEKYHQMPLPPQFEFLGEISQAKDIGVIYDKTEGMVFLLSYGAFQDIFRNEDFKSVENYRQIIMGYLEDPNISSMPFRRMVAKYPEHALNVFKSVFKRKRFSLEKDLPKILKRYKPMEQLTHLTPSAIPSSVRSKTFLRNLKGRYKW